MIIFVAAYLEVAFLLIYCKYVASYPSHNTTNKLWVY